jgi:hypothetical protein
MCEGSEELLDPLDAGWSRLEPDWGLRETGK